VSGVKSGVTTNYVTAVNYAPHGVMSSIAMGHGRYEQWCYNGRLAATAILLRASELAGSNCLDSAGNLETIRLGYTAGTDNGNVMSQDITDGTSWSVQQAYTYDKLNRLQSAAEGTQGAGWKYQFDYDTWGNQWVLEGQSYGLPSNSNRPVGSSWFTAKNRVNNRLHDRAGNQKQMISVTMDHDAENRMVQAVTSSATETYFYDGDGRRVKKVTALAGGTRTVVYVYTAEGELAAEYESGPSGGPMPCTTCYLYADHLGSTRAMWDAAGVKARYDYAPFGEEIAADRNGRNTASCAVPNCYGSPADVKQKFTSKERDEETGLDYFGARYYLGAQGRFTSPDQPFLDQHLRDPQSWNLYTYGRNNPLRYVDLLGTCTKPADAKADTPAGSICADPSTLKASPKLIEAIKGNEGKKLQAYIVPEGFNKDGTRNGQGLTVGYGHLVKPSDTIKEGDTITDEQATTLLTSDVESFSAGVRTTLGTTQASQQEFDALVDMAYGIGSISKTTAPSLMNAIQNQDYEAMGNELRTDRATNGIVLPGLQNRSTQRENIFRNGNYAPVSIYPKKKP
jgi:RHS repeat-associated protein